MSAFTESTTMSDNNKTFYIRVDGGPAIGAGHIVRCVSIAKEIEKQDFQIVFVSSGKESSKILSEYGYEPILVGGDLKHLGVSDAEKLRRAMEDGNKVLVDSYGVTDEFFKSCKELGLKVAYIDDMYTFETGSLSAPVCRDVDIVINYSFGLTEKSYEKVYGETATKLFIGPQYAPVREVFRKKAGQYQVREELKKVLITTGSTNPSKSLERLSKACREVLPDAEIWVIVGNSATFDNKLAKELNLTLIKGASDLSDYMLESDLVISAAGTTLYELHTLGVPTIAVPIVENQLVNARGFRNYSSGFASISLDWESAELKKEIILISSIQIRKKNSQKAISNIDYLVEQLEKLR